MHTIRILFEDLSHLDVQMSDEQLEDFHEWLRFANQNDVYTVSGTNQKITRGNIARTENIR